MRETTRFDDKYLQKVAATARRNAQRLPTNFADLNLMTSKDLTLLYASSEVGKVSTNNYKVPDGDSQGRAFVLAGTLVGSFLSGICNMGWKGKVVSRSSRSLINKVFGLRLFKAKVFIGESWFDGKEAIILDYRWTSLLAFFVRDEIREVPGTTGFFLGNMYVRLPFGKRFSALYFALDFRK